MSPSNERRALPREPAHLAAVIELEGREIGCGISRDASGSGLLLFTHVHIAEGSAVTLQLFFPQEEQPRRVDASVIRTERTRPEERIVWDYRMAVALRNPPGDLQELVQRITRPPPGAAP